MNVFLVNTIDLAISASTNDFHTPKVGKEELLIKVLWVSIKHKGVLAQIQDGKMIRSYPLLVG